MFRQAKFIGVAAGITLIAGAADAANCAKRDSVVKRLATQYSEQLVVRGLQSKNALMEIFASEESGTFTVLITTPQGVSCVVSAGTDLMFRDLEPIKPGTAG